MNRLNKELRIPSSLENLNQVEKFAEEICDDFYIFNTYYGNILLSLEEAVRNSILHGNRSDVQKEVIIRFNGRPGELCFTIEDEGDGFDVKGIPDPLEADEFLDQAPGTGIFLMRSLTDKLSFNPKGNQVELVFNISSINQETTLNRINKLHQYFQKQKSLA
jgi:serine/threonine-protein kinase RsbW